MRRQFGFGELAGSRGCRLRLVALVEQAPVIQRILRHPGLPDEVLAARPPRAPPLAQAAENAPAPNAGEVRLVRPGLPANGHWLPGNAEALLGDTVSGAQVPDCLAPMGLPAGLHPPHRKRNKVSGSENGYSV